MATTEIVGKVTMDLDRQPKTEIGDAARLKLALSRIDVVDEITYNKVNDIGTLASERIKSVELEFENDKKMAHQMHASITGRIKRWTEPYRAIREDAEKKMAPYILKLEETKLLHEQAIKDTGTQAREELIEQAREARAEGNMRLARELEEQAASIEVDVVLPDSTPEGGGLDPRREWIGVCDSLMELIVAIAEGKYPLMHKISVKGKEAEEPILFVNERVLGYLATKLTNSLKVPGCKAVRDVSFAKKRGKK